MEDTYVLAVALMLYILWNEFGRKVYNRRHNGQAGNPLNGEGSYEERLRAVENHINIDAGRGKAQWEELQRTLTRIEREQGIQRQHLRDLADKQIAPLSGRLEVMNERLLALERWRHGTPDPMLPQGGD